MGTGGALAAGAAVLLVIGSLLAAGAAHDRRWRSERGLRRDY